MGVCTCVLPLIVQLMDEVDDLLENFSLSADQHDASLKSIQN